MQNGAAGPSGSALGRFLLGAQAGGGMVSSDCFTELDLVRSGRGLQTGGLIRLELGFACPIRALSQMESADNT